MKPALAELHVTVNTQYPDVTFELNNELQIVALCHHANPRPATIIYTEAGQNQMGKKERPLRPRNFTWLLVAATFANSA